MKMVERRVRPQDQDSISTIAHFIFFLSIEKLVLQFFKANDM
jgi:hypothetical protein